MGGDGTGKGITFCYQMFKIFLRRERMPTVSTGGSPGQQPQDNPGEAGEIGDEEQHGDRG
jgi:hypothetical protein